MKNLILLFAVLLAFSVSAQTTWEMPITGGDFAGDVEYTVSNGDFFEDDNFFASGYYRNQSRAKYVTLYPETGSTLCLEFTSFWTESGYDEMIIFDGTSQSDPRLVNFISGNLAPFTVTATNPQGALLIRFYSDFSVSYPGWVANISCIESCNIEASGEDFNTIYGYTEEYACVTLEPTITGGSAPFTYLWSDGSTGSTLSVCPDADATYSVTVTDASECTADATFNVAVENIICEAGESGEHKVYICHKEFGNNPQTLCVDKSAVEAHMAHGDGLGMCDADKSSIITPEGEVSGEVLYYDIMGRQLTEKPIEGLYIESVNGKTTKKYIVK